MKLSSSLNLFCAITTLTFFICACQTDEASKSKGFNTKSGYQVEILDRSTNNPARGSAYVMYSSDVLIGDTVVNSSRLGAPYLFYKSEQDITSKRVSPVAEALHLMHDKDSVRLWYPLENDQHKPEWFGDAEFLEYRIKIHALLDEQAYAQEFQTVRNQIQENALLLQSLESDVSEFSNGIYQDYKSKGSEGWEDLASGVKVLIHEKGSGKLAIQGSYASVAYFGRLASTGTSFSNSFRDGRAFSFKLGLGEAIAGWDIALKHLPEGSKATLFVPAELAYGKRGFPPEIGADEDLLFYIEVLRVI